MTTKEAIDIIVYSSNYPAAEFTKRRMTTAEKYIASLPEEEQFAAYDEITKKLNSIHNSKQNEHNI